MRMANAQGRQQRTKELTDVTDPTAGIADNGRCEYRVLFTLPSLVPLRAAVQALVVDVPQCAV